MPTPAQVPDLEPAFKATQNILPKLDVFFSSSMADVALWLGPYISIGSKNVICTETKKTFSPS